MNIGIQVVPAQRGLSYYPLFPLLGAMEPRAETQASSCQGVLALARSTPGGRGIPLALDLILDAPPSGCYTLPGTRLDERGDIVDPIRVDWQAGGAFTTPPGMWHAHYNETDEPAHPIPIQDVGLQTHLRSLDIKFSQRRDLVAG